MLTRSLQNALAGLALVVLGTSACERVPLTAPSGSTISLTTSVTTLGSNDSTEIVAQLLEAAGVPPHSGTTVTFTTNMGRVVPAVAETDASGRARVTFQAAGASGTAVISAASGGASSGTNGSVRIAVGTAAVGRVSLSANPNPISANGGVATITANVVDLNGGVLPGVLDRKSTRLNSSHRT